MTGADQFSYWTEARFGGAPFLVFADHASNAVPDDLNQLGLSPDILDTHIAFDIGSAATADSMAAALRGRVFRCGFSRLVLDVNRAENRADLIPPVSDSIPVPGNHGISQGDREARIARFHATYHAALGERMAAAATEAAFIVSVHSFTPRLMGAMQDRPWHIGLLWRHDEASARRFMAWLERCTDWVVGDNKPYDAREFNYSIDRHVAPRGLPHLTIEVRQDLIANERDASAVGRILAEGVQAVAAEPASDCGS